MTHEGMDLQKDVINYIYQNVPLYRFRYGMLKTIQDLDFLEANPHYVGINYIGYNNLLIFSRFRNTYYSFFVDRKTLKYNIDDLDMNSAIIKATKMRASIEVYEGTIFDGILTIKDGKKFFIISDAFSIAGDTDTLKMDRRPKLQRIQDFVTKNIKYDPEHSNVELLIDKMYMYNELTSIRDNVIPECQFLVRGLIFYPRFSGKKIIYTFPPEKPKTQKKLKYEEQTETEELTEKDLTNETRSVIIKDMKNTYSVHGVFEIRKGEGLDMYKLYLYQPDRKKNKKYGIACVPSKECSLFCSKLFEKETSDPVIVKCVYVENREKWMPQKLMKKKKKPDTFDEITAKIET